MVDKELNFLVKNEKYGYLIESRTESNFVNRLVYNNGENLKYGDPAEIFPVSVSSENFNDFMNAAIDETHFGREHYGFFFGYYPATQDNIEIKETEVYINYAGVSNIILKKDFFESSILACQAQIRRIELNVSSPHELSILQDTVAKLQDKLKKYQV
jgi:hypothetical protein